MPVCISFLSKSSGEICQKVDVVGGQHGSYLCFLGAKLRDLGHTKKPYIYIYSGAILGPSFAILWMMSKLSRAMVIMSGFWRAMLGPFGGSNVRIEGSNILSWGQVWPSWALLRCVEGVCHVEAICQILFGHVVSLASRNALPPAQPRFKAGFCELCWLHCRAILWPRWCHLQTNFGDFGAIWDHFGLCCFGIVKNNPPIHLRNAPPGPEGETE